MLSRFLLVASLVLTVGLCSQGSLDSPSHIFAPQANAAGAPSCSAVSTRATYSSGDHSCIYHAGTMGVIGGGEVVSEVPSGQSDCNGYHYIDVGDGPTIQQTSQWSAGDHSCIYNCPTDYALVGVVAENTTGSADCNSYKCRYIGSGGRTLKTTAKWSGTDHGCVYTCPAGYAMRGFVAENPVAGGAADCNTFTAGCQEVMLCNAPPAPKPQCRDGIDNDYDGKIDYPNDPGCSNGDDNDETNVPPTADLSITKYGPSSVMCGNTISYTVTVSNAGPAPATNVLVTDVIPSGLTFNAGASSAGCYLNSDSTSVLCNNFDLAANQSKTFTIAFNVQIPQQCAPRSIINKATVSASCSDPNSSNNTSQEVWTSATCPETSPQCRDGIDNDYDGKVDYPNDPGCSNADDNDESNASCSWAKKKGEWVQKCY